MPPLITLTTDFGTSAPYVAAMKGVILSLAPDASLHDLSHTIPAQNIHHAARFLCGSLPYFPIGSIHVCVVDPGVGSARAALLIEAGGQFLLGPDNGCLDPAARRLGDDPVVRHLTNARFFRSLVSATFHGRDIFAPVAGHLARGTPPSEFGPRVATWTSLTLPQPRVADDTIVGEVAFIDDFGNLITNIPFRSLAGTACGIRVGMATLPDAVWVRTYAEAPPGQVVVLASSDGWLEIAMVSGNAARLLLAETGTVIAIDRSPD